MIREKMDLDVEVSRLRLLKASHQSQQYRMEDRLLKYFPEQIERTQSYITGFQSDIALAEKTTPQAGEFAGMEVLGRSYSDKEAAGTAILNACKAINDMQSIPLGSYRGFSMSLSLKNFGKDYMLTLKGQMSHKVMLGTDPRGNILRIDNALNLIPERLSQVQRDLDNLRHQRDAAKLEVEKPFPQEAELQVKSTRLIELDMELNMEAGSSVESICEEGDAAMPEDPEKPSIQADWRRPHRTVPSLLKHLFFIYSSARSKFQPSIWFLHAMALLVEPSISCVWIPNNNHFELQRSIRPFYLRNHTTD